MASSSATQQLVCQHCGSQLMPAMLKCRECGTPVRKGDSDSSSPSPKAAATSPAAPSSPASTATDSAQDTKSFVESTSTVQPQQDTQNPSAEHQQTATNAPSSPPSPAAEPPAFLKIQCACGKRLKVRRKYLGKTLTCPHCKTALTVAEPRELDSKATDSSTFERLSDPGTQRPSPPPPDNTPAAASGTGIDRVEDEEELDEDELAKRRAEQTSTALIAEIDNALLHTEINPDVELKSKLSSSAFEKLEHIILHCDTANRESVDECRHAISQLAQSRDARALNAIAIQARSPKAKLREAVAFACGLLPQPETVRYLIEYLGDDDSGVRRAALMAIENKQSPLAVRPLLALAVHDRHSQTRAVDLIVALESKAVDPLVEVLQKAHPDWSSLAAMALGKIGGESAVAGLTELLRHESPVVRELAIDGLGRHIEDDGVLRTLIKMLEDPVPAVRVGVLRSLSKTHDPRCIPRLLKLTEDADPAVRRQAIESLSGKQDAKVTDRLIALLDDTDTDIVVVAVDSLSRCGDQRAVTPLLELLERAEVPPEPVLTSLRRLDNASQSPRLVKLLESPDATIRRLAVEALACCPSSSVRRKLVVRLAQDRDKEVRASAARALARVPDLSVVSNLRAALSDESTVRVQAVIALGEIGHESCFQPLIESLVDAASPVRYHAAVALGKLGNDDAIDPLRGLLQDQDAMVRRGVEAALQQLGESKRERMYLQLRKRLRRIGDSLTPGVLFNLLPQQPAVLGAVATVIVLAAIGGWYFFSRGPTGAAAVIVRGNVYSAQFLPGTSQLAVSRTKGAIEIWSRDATSADRIWQADASDDVIALPANGDFAFVCRDRLKWSSVTDGSADSDKQSEEHADLISGVSTTPDHRFAATYTKNGQIFVWDLAGRKLAQQLDLKIRTLSVALGMEGKLLVVVTRSRELQLFEVDTGTQLGVIPTKYQIQRTAFHPTLPIMAGSDADGRVLLWNFEDGSETPFGVSEVLPGPINVMQFSPDGQKLVTGYASGALTIWTVETEEAKVVSDLEADQIDSLSFSDDGKLLAVGSEAHPPVWIVDFASGSLESELDQLP